MPPSEQSISDLVAAWTPAAVEASGMRDRGLLTSRFAAHVAALESTDGPARRAEFLRGTLAALITLNRPKIPALNLPDVVKQLIEREYARIEKLIARGKDEEFDFRIHSARCDFRIAALARVPVGVEHIELGGVPRNVLWKGGLRQALSVGRVFAQARGAAPFYVGHLTHGIKPWAFLMAYNPETQEFWHRNVAACLARNPHVHGFWASSWLYDPQLAWVAPHLAFLREGSVAHGAILVHVGPTEGALKNALARSPEREALWKAGKYVPTIYGVLWTREAMMRWADRR